jgi:hypothetical protein
MLADIAIDTNVLMHADDPRQNEMQIAAIQLISGVLESRTALCVDEGAFLGARNRSHIVSEYQKHLSPTGLGFYFVVQMTTDGRLKQLSRSVGASVSRTIRANVPPGCDRTFVRVTYNAVEKVFTSHDFTDFPAKVRKILRDELCVRVMDAASTLPLL